MAGHREGETAGGKQDRLQAQRVMDLALKFWMVQKVDKSTNSVKILDLLRATEPSGRRSWSLCSLLYFIKYRISDRQTLQKVRYKDYKVPGRKMQEELVRWTGSRWSPWPLTPPAQSSW